MNTPSLHLLVVIVLLMGLSGPSPRLVSAAPISSPAEKPAPSAAPMAATSNLTAQLPPIPSKNALHLGWANDAIWTRTGAQGRDDAMLSAPCSSALTVQNTNDSGPGSLRQALVDVCPGGRIDFASSLAGQTITLAAQLEITQNLAIDGRSLVTPVQISGNGNVRVLNVAGSAHLTLEALRIVRGQDDIHILECDGRPCGSGIQIGPDAVVTLTYSAVISNTASQGSGGGIYNAGTLMVLGSTLSRNMTPRGGGGGIYNTGTLMVLDSTLSDNVGYSAGGGILNSGIAIVLNSTLSHNLAFGNGGGIANWSGTLTVIHSTLFRNSVDGDGGGIYNPAGSRLYSLNTIIASEHGGDCVNRGTVLMNAYSLVKDGSCNAKLSGDPLLDVLADNGGRTLTHALLPGSPALDAIPIAACLRATDQRGVSRPQPARGKCDIGAFESRGFTPAFTSAPVTTATQNVPYTYTITARGPDVAASGPLTITAPVRPGWLALTDHGDGTATLAGTPTQAEVGQYPVTLRVTASGGLTATQTFIITVAPTTQYNFLPAVLQ